MTASALIALSLLLSVGAAALTLSLASFLTRSRSGSGLDPRLNEAVWRTALWLPLAPPVLVATLLLTPAPVAPPAAPIAAPVPMTQDAIEIVAPLTAASPPPALILDWTPVSQIGLALALGLSLLRLGLLGLRTRPLGRLIKHATPAAPDVATAVADAARLLNQRPPSVRISAHTPEALLAGLFRPVLVLPFSLAETPDGPAFRAVVRHELAHLKRRDHFSLWLEEALLVLLAVNPLAPLLRRGRAAAREEACDVLALNGADTETRRAYAQSLIEALRATNTHPHSTPELSTPALTFTGHPRSQAMHRLKSILTPPTPASRRARLAALALGAALTSLLGLGSYAVAAQRAPQAAPAQDGEILRATQSSPLSRDWAWTTAALNPIYKAAWPAACGFGSDNNVAFIHLGEGCTTASTANPRILSVAGVDLSAAPRDAFAAVRRECAARRLVTIRYTQNAGPQSVSVACDNIPISPAERIQLDLSLTYDQGSPIQAGDRLIVDLTRATPDGSTWREGLNFDLTPGAALPAKVKAEVDPEFFGANATPTMLARIVSRDGVVRAESDPYPRPFLVGGAPRSPTQASGFVVLKTVGGDSSKTMPRTARATTTTAQTVPTTQAASGSTATPLPPVPEGRTRVLVSMDYGPNPVRLTSDDRLRIFLTGFNETGAKLAQEVAMSAGENNRLPDTVFVDLHDEYFPKGRANTAYELRAEISHADKTPIAASEPVTVRLAPGSRALAERLRPQLVMRPL